MHLVYLFQTFSQSHYFFLEKYWESQLNFPYNLTSSCPANNYLFKVNNRNTKKKGMKYVKS